MRKQCEVDACSNPVHGNGLCNMHRLRLRRNGSLDLVQMQYASPDEAFEARTEWDGDCLVWTGGNSGAGYGIIFVNGSRTYAHRYAWQRQNGPIPPGVEIDHECHNPPCVNIEHLRPAVHRQNLANRSGANRGSSTGLRNVYTAGSRYRVVITKDGKQFYFGRYDSIDEAAKAAEQGRRELFADFGGR